MGKATTVMTLGAGYDAKRAERLKALVAGIGGVDFVDFNYTNNRITVKFDPDRLSLERLKGIVARESKRRFRPAESQRSESEAGGE